METLGLSVSQYQQAFRTDKQCVKYIFKCKYPNGFNCRKCDHAEYYNVYKGGGSRQCKACKYEESAKSGTLFHRSQVPLRKWFAAILEFTISKGGISAVELQRRLGFGSYETAWSMLHKLRIAMGKRDEDYTLSGLVEVDGVNMGRKKKDGTKNKFYMAVEELSIPGKKHRKAGFAKMVSVEDYGQAKAKDFVQRNIKAMSHVKTDNSLDFKYGLEKVNVKHDAQVMDGFKIQ